MGKVKLQFCNEIKDNKNRDVIPVLFKEKEKLRYARVFSLPPKKTGIYINDNKIINMKTICILSYEVDPDT